jgi:uncharacterized protein DUF4124
VQTISNRAGTAKVIMSGKHMMAKICAAAILSSGGGVEAQTIYKQTDATGRTIFTDRPPAGIAVPYETFPNRERDLVSPLGIATGTWSESGEGLVQQLCDDVNVCRYRRL